METVQLTIHDTRYSSALGDLLERNGTREVRYVNMPDPRQDGVIVVDADALDSLPLPLPSPERFVLVTHNDPEHLAKAWNAGVRSVVFDEDPLSTAVLAIMAAELRISKGEAHWAVCHTAPARPGSGSAGLCMETPKAGTPATLTTLEHHVHVPKPRDEEGLK